MANKEELKATLAAIEAEPDKHEQMHWFCGTTACFAGHVVLRHGWQPVPEGSDPHSGRIRQICDNDEHLSFAEDTAAEICGLSPRQAMMLFFNADTIDELRVVITDIIDNDGTGEEALERHRRDRA